MKRSSKITKYHKSNKGEARTSQKAKSKAVASKKKPDKDEVSEFLMQKFNFD